MSVYLKNSRLFLKQSQRQKSIYPNDSTKTLGTDVAMFAPENTVNQNEKGAVGAKPQCRSVNLKPAKNVHLETAVLYIYEHLLRFYLASLRVLYSSGDQIFLHLQKLL